MKTALYLVDLLHTKPIRPVQGRKPNLQTSDQTFRMHQLGHKFSTLGCGNAPHGIGHTNGAVVRTSVSQWTSPATSGARYLYFP